MTMNVAMPAFTSVPTVVPRSASLKKEAIAPGPLLSLWQPSNIAGYSSLSDGRPCAVGLAPLACLPGSVGRFTAVEHAQLHLDVVGGHWERETLLLGLVSSASTNGGELDDDPLVTL